MKLVDFFSRLNGAQNPLFLGLSVSIGFGLFFLAFLPPGIYSLDGNSMLAVSESLVVNHNVEVPPGLGIAGREGHIYSNWYPLLSLVVLPLVALAHLFSQLLHLPFHYLAAIFIGSPGAIDCDRRAYRPRVPATRCNPTWCVARLG